MLISEQLFLILDGSSRGSGDWAQRGTYGLRGAVLADLLLAGRLDLTPDRDPLMRVIDDAPTHNPILDDALSRLPTDESIRISSAIGSGEHSLKDTIAAHAAAGSDGSPSPAPEGGPVPERGAGIVDRLIAVLKGERPATAADQVLLSILKGLGLGRAVLPGGAHRPGLERPVSAGQGDHRHERPGRAPARHDGHPRGPDDHRGHG
ncbi:GPP34 family phosphoprotein [Actinomyces timonensis]|uniref:GPP34 family phosphoprotein n=1 Tax=Actinomyces timonensis TaxID=1288391 RepID=A0AAU8N016_9ACTO